MQVTDTLGTVPGQAALDMQVVYACEQACN